MSTRRGRHRRRRYTAKQRQTKHAPLVQRRKVDVVERWLAPEPAEPAKRIKRLLRGRVRGGVRVVVVKVSATESGGMVDRRRRRRLLLLV
jgi:hypothetical protein